MAKNLKMTFILFMCLAGVVMAFKTLVIFFSGAGIAFVALLGLLGTLCFLCKDAEVRRRVLDIFIIACVLVALEFFTYFIIDILTKGYARGLNVYQSVVSVLAIIYFAYIIFRWVMEGKGAKVSFIESMLGNRKTEKKPKKAKELTNGSLMEKPNKKHVEESSNFSSIEQTEVAVNPTTTTTVTTQTTTYTYPSNDENSEN